MSNASDLISYYNLIDARMRAIYRGKGNLQFSDLVRRCAECNKTVKRYEEELISLARLRNAIVHNSTKEQIIAEPSDAFTSLSKHIYSLLSAPPRLSALKERGATGISDTATVGDAIRLIAKTDYSNLPVYRKDRAIGILNNRRLVQWLGERLDDGLDELLNMPCTEIMREEDFPRYYVLLSRDDTVQDALDAFENNRKLLAVIVTENGRLSGRITNLLTASDLPKLYELLDEEKKTEP